MLEKEAAPTAAQEVSAHVAELRRRLAEGADAGARGARAAGKVGPPDRFEVGMDRRMPELLEQLRKAVGESHVVAGAAVSDDYTHDEALTSVPVTPLAVVLPGSTDEVSEVLEVASEHGVPVVARGSGTGLSGAAVPVADGILLAFDRMRRIREIDTENQVAVVEPGVTLEQLNAELAPLGLDLPGLPGRAERVARRERGHQRRRHARRPLRGDPPPRAGPRGRAGRRQGPADRRQVREVLERVRPDPAARSARRAPWPSRPR